MNFKNEYQKAFKDISAGDDFKKQLERELTKSSSPGKKYTSYAGMLATAAALAIMVGAAHYTGVFRDAGELGNAEESLMAQESSDVNNKGFELQPGFMAEGDSDKIQGQNFSPQAVWCAGVESDEEKYELFVELMGSEEVEKIYAAEKQGFSEEDVLEKEDIVTLVQILKTAVPGEKVEESNVKYYKAVLTEERTIVFQIWDEEFVRIAGIDTIYKISN